MVCNGLGIWIRKKPVLSSYNTPTTSNVDAASNNDPYDIDSDEDDYTYDVQINPHSASLENSPNSLESSDESLDTSNDVLNDNYDTNLIANAN